jgi:hypothetical protein
MDHAVQTGPERFRRHLRQPHAPGADPLEMNDGNTHIGHTAHGQRAMVAGHEQQRWDAGVSAESEDY